MEESQYGAENVVCQDCHMTEGITEFEANPGRAGSGAPKRDHISSHDIVGGNAFIPVMFGADNVAEMAVERLQRAATVEVSAPEIAAAGEEIDLEVSITNSGAGHYIPTGVSEIRQMWVEVNVTDADGNLIYSAGNLDDQGNIEDAKLIYNNVLADSEGNPTESFWLAESVLEDNRIAPQETVTEEHSFTVPDSVAYPLTVETKLNYRSASQEIIDHLLGEDTEVPVVIMNDMSSTVFDPATPADERTTEPTPGFGILATSMSLVLMMYLIKRK
ncbi:MAG: hypothetical protein R2741_04775 [Methanolobus sp.]